MKKELRHTRNFLEQIKQLLREAQQNVVRSVNSIMVQTYFELGRRIVEHEQEGKRRSRLWRTLTRKAFAGIDG